ncbi:transcriptional regulator [Pyxidicoccus xibeiensis]|uniref:transcriptional regulator n=1 Tax=Pyxidicoccus xibeiensis TaxID=2906759 RepID=UPI0020A80D82|nr:transcriptional regulator [Pyxidicoccus xibeiensis]MCP3139604.1 transcriptional regulator [Pyxidicoccus xibeiensis]
MPRGSKAKYTEKQKRMAEHIEEGYEKRGLSEGTAESRAWATVNKLTGGGMKGGSGSKAKAARQRPVARKNAKKAGAKGGKARAARKSTSARKSPKRSTRASGSKAAVKRTAAKRATAKKRTSTAGRSRSTAKRGGARKSTRGRSSTRK